MNSAITNRLSELISGTTAAQIDGDRFEREVLQQSQHLRSYQSQVSLILVVVSGAVYLWALSDHTNAKALTIWIGAIFISSVIRAAVCIKIQGELSIASTQQLLNNEIALLATAVTTPLIIGLGFWFVGTPGDESTVFAITLLSVLYALGTTINSLTAIRTLPLLLLLNAGQGIIYFLTLSTETDIALAVSLLSTVLLLLRFAKRNALFFRESTRMRLEHTDQNIQLLKNQQIIESSLSSAVEANRSQSRFLAAASHDLRQPLHAMTLFIGVMKSTDLTDHQSQLLTRLEDTAELLRSQFTALLDLSRFDSGGVNLNPQLVSLEQVVRSVSQTLSTEANAKGLDYQTHGPALSIQSDPVLLDRLLRNLVSNAIKYTEKGGVTLSWEKTAVGVSIRISDTGIGIHENEIASIFDEFYQVENKARQRADGSGLGLAIVSRIAELMNITINIESTPGEGTSFTLTLPETLNTELPDTDTHEPGDDSDHSDLLGVTKAGPTPANATLANSTLPNATLADATLPNATIDNPTMASPTLVSPTLVSHTPGQDNSLLHRTILIADDDEYIRDALEFYVRSRGGNALLAANYDDAVALLQRHSPDFVILDDMLQSEYSGLDIATFALDTLPAEQIVFITGNESKERLADIEAQGFTVLRKPQSAEQLDTLLAARL